VTDARRPSPREAAVDGLRALALLPVVAVNWVGYAALPDAGPLAAAQPAGSAAGQGMLLVVAALLAGKGVALLSFLFGYGQGLSRRARGAQAAATRRRRVGRLLLLGLAHGLLIYAGDILTTYAICGWLMLGWSRLRLRRLWRRLWVFALVHTLLVSVVSAWLLLAEPGDKAVLLGSLAAPNSVPGWLAVNAGGFVLNQLNVLVAGLFLPLALMTAGLMAARLRLFSHRRWRPALARLAGRWLWAGLLANIAWGVALVLALESGDEHGGLALYAFNAHVAVLWLLGLVPALVLAAQRGAGWMQRLAPLGPHTLSVYIGSSLLSLGVLGGAGLALPLGTAALVLMALLYWSAWLALALRLRGRLALERWLSR
jgi:uncharacterized protein